MSAAFSTHPTPQLETAPTPNSRRDWLWILGGIVIALIVALLGRPHPSPLAESVPVTKFSAVRAFRHIEKIAASPHPTGTQANDEVLDYLRSTLTTLGAEPRVQESDMVERAAGGFRAVHVKNLIGTVPGTHNTGTVLLVAHYDSAKTSKGAADDGAGVAVLLETLSALKAGAPPRNDIIFLFTDSEELGTKGAQAFRTDPAAKNVSVVLNFDARGSGGPAIMFETQPYDGWLIKAFIARAPHVVTNSLAPAIYKLLNNDTDFTPFKHAGKAGLNFAFAGQFETYHSALDTASALDASSVQQEGDYALEMARYLGGLNLGETRPHQELIYFPLLGMIVSYPASLSLPLSLLVTTAFLIVAAIGIARGRIKIARAILFFATLPFTAIIAVVITRFLLAGVEQASHARMLFEGNLLALAVITLAVAAFVLLQLSQRKWTNPETMAAGGFLWMAILSVATATFLKGASYVFVWPLFFATASLALKLFFVKESTTKWQKLLPDLLLLPAMLVFVPVVRDLFTAFVMVGSALVAAFIVVFLAVLTPALFRLVARPLKIGGAIFAVAIAILATVYLRSSQNVSHPGADYILYTWNEDNHTGTFATGAGKLDSFTSQILGKSPSTSQLAAVVPAWFGELPKLEMKSATASDALLSAPHVEWVQGKTGPATWQVTYRVVSVRRAPEISIVASGPELFSIKVNDKAVQTGPGMQTNISEQDNKAATRIALVCMGSPRDGWLISYSGRGLTPLKIEVADRSYELPTTGLNLPRRPADIIPERFTGDSTFVAKSYTF